jgi:transcriptional regulator with XRE-family HTH domain
MDQISAEQIRAARALLRMEQRELSEKAQVPLPTLKRLEGQAGVLRTSLETAARLVNALTCAGVIFIPETTDEGEGVRRGKLQP